MVNDLAEAFLVRPFNDALIGPFARHTGFAGGHLAVLLAWDIAGG